MPEVKTQEWIEQVLEEHRELTAMVQDLRDFLEQPRPPAGAQGSHSWAAELSGSLCRLHDKLFRHFRYEEEEGMVEEISVRRPRLTQDVEELMDEHPQMLTEIRGVMADVLCYSEGKEPENPQLRQRLLKVLDDLRDHERKENHLIQRLEYSELGSAG